MSSRRGRWPDVQFFFPSSAAGGGAPRDVDQPATTTRRSDCKDEEVEEDTEERFDILSALPEEVALRVLGGGELATRLGAENSCCSDGGPTWSAWELRQVVSRVCRNWRRLALDAGLLASTLNQYHRGRTGPSVSPGGEVIHVQIGNCGNMVGKEYWRALVHEHSLDPSSFAISEQITGLPVSFDETATGRFTARSILVDTDPASLDLIRASPLAKLFRPDCCALDWEEAHFFSGKAVSEAAAEAIQREMERCDRVQAFVFFHSLGGGCGSGLTTSVVTELAQERLFQPPIINFAFVPSSCTVDPITNRKLTTREACNTMLGFNALIEYSGATFLIDNGALKRSVSYLPILSTTAAHSAMNLTAAAAISGVTCPQRFPVLGAECLGSWRKLIHVGVPFPRAHFFSLSHAPFSSDGRTHCSTAELMREVFTEGACLTGLPPDAASLARSHWDKTTSFFNFVCVRGRRTSWRDAARELEAIKQHRRSLPSEADEVFDEEEYEIEDEDEGEGDARTTPTTVNGAQLKKEEGRVAVDEEDDDDDTRTTFIPRETEWLPDSHVRYAYCPVAYAPPSSSSSSSSSSLSSSSALGDGASATLVSANTRTFSRYLARFFDRFRQLPDASALCTEDRLLLHEAQSNLSDLQSEFRHT